MSQLVGRLEAKHWGLIASFLASTATVIAGFDHWGDATKPAVVAGIIMQLATLIGAVFAGAPANPHSRHRRRHNDGAHVSDSTRRNL